MENQVELLYRRLERERRARKEAEKIIEEKSRELYLKSQELELFAEAEHQARNEADILRRALEAFMTRLDQREIVVQLEEFLSILFPQDSRAIYLFDPDGLRLHSISCEYKGSKQAGDLISTTVLLGNITQSSHPIIMSDNSNEEIRKTWGIQNDTRTWMAAPMVVFDRNIGYITLENRQTEAYNENTTKLVQALANEAAIALENARLFQELEILSTIDPLTGLHNRRHFNATAHLEYERSQRYDLPLSAIMMDIDHFKHVNDTYGHASGDDVLVKLAAVCKQNVRLTDIVARFGGEEFCLLLVSSQ